ncbi:alpha/beta fold hydrolase [Mycetocola sp. 2940]|uniref:alpha/beta hydrolase family protein n=1 Tax=Mycetocola sp. 2940 TaxID=3156452 RepID=UPI0033929980
MRVTWAATGVVAAAGVAFGGLGLVIARRLTAPGGRQYDLTIRGVETSGELLTVVLDRTPRTTLHGLYSLFVENGGRVRLSPEAEDRGPGLVARQVLGEPGEGLTVGGRASWSGIIFSSPEDAGLAVTDVEVPTGVGPSPAWLVAPEGDSSTIWAIHIHGLGGSRAGVLRGVHAASEAGLTSLVVTYRNDGEGPFVGTGRSGLGSDEADDVRAAVRFARENGARSVVLVGWSMGAAIALQLGADAEFHGLIAGLVLESPVLDWVSTIRANCARAGMPDWTGVLAVPWLKFRTMARVTGLANRVDLRRFDWIARADELTVPTLILHGSPDTSSPFALSARLRDLRPDIVDLEAFDADHTMTWNSDCERWQAVVCSWLAGRASTGTNAASAASVPHDRA